jgi:hypothetical protein
VSVRGTFVRGGVVLLGAWVGALGAVVHRATDDVAGVPVPWGLGLSLLTVLLAALACDRVVAVGAAWFGLGWTLVLMLQQVRGSGSYLIAADTLGWGYTIGGLGVCGVVVALAPRLGR